MDTGNLSDALTLIMKERGWTQSELATELGMSQEWVSKVSRGKTDTGIAKAAKLLARVGWEVRISPKSEDPVERREFIAAAASVIFVPSAKASPYQDPGYLRTLTKSIARNRYELGGIPLAPAAATHAACLQEALTNSRDSALQSAASELLDQASLVLYDAGKLTQADQVGGLALSFALRGRDIEGQARAHDSLSRISLYRGDYARGVIFAQRGLQLPGISNGQRASLNMRLGRSLALIPGQEAASRDALDHALGIDGLSPFTKSAVLGDVGIAFGHLRQYRQAGALLTEATDAIAQWSPLFQAQYLGRQVQTALRASDIDFAADRIRQLARALPFVTSDRVNKRVHEILRASAKWGSTREMGLARQQLRSVAKR